MGWDSDKPSNSEKLRQLGEVIRPNWKAIEEGDETDGTPIAQRAILLGNRNDIATAQTPVVVGATHYIYSKLDTGTTPTQELFARSAAGHIVQLTNDRGLGGSVPRIFLSDFEFTQNMLPSAMAYVNNSGMGSFYRKVNFNSVSRPGSGQIYLVTDAIFANANVYVTAMALQKSSKAMTVMFEEAPTIMAGAITIKLVVKNDSGSTDSNDIMVVMYGGVA